MVSNYPRTESPWSITWLRIVKTRTSLHTSKSTWHWVSSEISSFYLLSLVVIRCLPEISSQANFLAQFKKLFCMKVIGVLGTHAKRIRIIYAKILCMIPRCFAIVVYNYQCWIERHVTERLKMSPILRNLCNFILTVQSYILHDGWHVIYWWCCIFYFPRCLAACCCHVPPANPAMLPFHWPIAATVLCILISRHKW